MKRGFTLIELLVVISIIAVLSSIVLASLSSARTKANDTKVQAQMNSIKTAAQLVYSNNGSNYGPGSGVNCTSLTSETTSGMANLMLASKWPNNISPSCTISSDGTSILQYSIFHALSSGNWSCVDSHGNSMTITTPATGKACDGTNL